jgi:hypothetical protein
LKVTQYTSSAFSFNSESLNEEKLIRVYKECQLELKIHFLQQIIKPEQMSESLSLPMSINMMVIEVQWVCSLLSQVLGLDSDKYVVEVTFGFLLIFFKSESGQ